MFVQRFKITVIVSALFGAILFSSCKKKAEDVIVYTTEASKWDVIPGNYKIYDTLGNYLYDMNISHWTIQTEEGIRKDTFQFSNLDGQFSVKAYQPEVNPSNYPKYFFYLGSQQPIYDFNGDRWQFFGYDAYYSNDSIYLEYKLFNLLYYIEDARPYESRLVNVVGIKQP